jgi:hypothetical protein
MGAVAKVVTDAPERRVDLSKLARRRLTSRQLVVLAALGRRGQRTTVPGDLLRRPGARKQRVDRLVRQVRTIKLTNDKPRTTFTGRAADATATSRKPRPRTAAGADRLSAPHALGLRNSAS